MNRFAHKHRTRKGQALTEFIFMLPLLILALFIAMQGQQVLLQNIRVHAAQWFALRADTFATDDRQKFTSSSTVASDIQDNMFDTSTPNLTVSVSNSNSVSVIDAIGAFAPLMFPLMKETTVKVSYSLDHNPSNFLLIQASGWDGNKGSSSVTCKMVQDAITE